MCNARPPEVKVDSLLRMTLKIKKHPIPWKKPAHSIWNGGLLCRGRVLLRLKGSSQPNSSTGFERCAWSTSVAVASGNRTGVQAVVPTNAFDGKTATASHLSNIRKAALIELFVSIV